MKRSDVASFAFRGGRLHAEGVDLGRVAAAVGTPVYCYSRAAMEARYRRFERAIAPLRGRICYAVKANSNLAVLRVFARLGAGMDVVSEGELRRARAAGVPGQMITFSGVGKTETEIAHALGQDVGFFNVESEPELDTLSAIAATQGVGARVAVRVNPDIDARTHAKIATGKAENKFGIPIARARDVYARARTLPNLECRGIDIHIGSQITAIEPFEAAFAAVAELVASLRADGHAIDHVDLGGGLGIDYGAGTAPHDDFAQLDRYAAAAARSFGALGVTTVFEPGRFLVAEAGVLLTRVIRVKSGFDKVFVVVDAAMNDLIRPTLYEAHHAIVPVLEARAAARRRPADVVGPVCETGDYLALGRDLPELAAGDLLAILAAGAYGAVQASTYNSRLLVPEVMVDGSEFHVIRPRTDYEALLALDKVPQALA